MTSASNAAYRPVGSRSGSKTVNATPILRGSNTLRAQFARRDHPRQDSPSLVELDVGIAASDVNGMLRIEVGTVAAMVGDGRPVEPEHRGKVLAGKTGTLVAVAGMPEIGMTVDVYEPCTTPRPDGEAGADEEAAIAAEHERTASALPHLCQAIGQPIGVIENRGVVAKLV
jgi:hypothetical protein